MSTRTKNSSFPQGVETLVIHTNDVDDLLESTGDAGWDEQADLLSPGEFVGHLEVAQVDWLQLADVRYGSKLLMSGEPPPGCMSLALALEVTDYGTFGGNAVDPGVLMLAREGQEFQHLVSQGLRMLLISIPTEILDIPGMETLPHLLHLSPDMQQALVHTISAGISAAWSPDSPLDAAASRQRLCQDVLALTREVMTQGLPALPPCSTNSTRATRLEDAIRSTLGDRVTVEDLAEQLEISTRTLRRVSRAAFGTSPQLVQRSLRLNAVRQDLRRHSSDDTTVWNIAGNYGFWHMGQFGRDYRNLFSVTPSQTLARKG